MESIINNYIDNIYIAVPLAIITFASLIFILKKPIKFLISLKKSYKNDLNDLTFSINKNKEKIFFNDELFFKKSLNKKNFFILSASLPIGIIHPFFFAAFYLYFAITNLRYILLRIKDFKLFDDDDNNDFILNLFNEKINKINITIENIINAGYVLIGGGIILNNVLVASVGLSIVILILILNVIVIYNTFMYKANLKLLNYYKMVRILGASNLLDISTVPLLVLSIATNFSDLSGFNIFIWIATAIKILIDITVNSLFNENDFISEEHQKIENRNYTEMSEIASYPNLISQSRGYKFTTALQMKLFELEKELSNNKLIHIDNYAFYPEALNRTELRKNPILKQKIMNSVKINFEILDLTKQIMILGGMGSGKTELINYLIEQVHTNKFTNYKAIAYNDTKGDFSKNFYRKDKDILVNLYDKRASVWCPFLEMKTNIEAGTAFIDNLFETIQGSEKDFFSASAKMKTSVWLQESYFATSDNIEAWKLFFTKIKDFEEEIKENDDKTQSSILATIKIALEILSIMYYQIVKEKRDTFTFNHFVNSEDIQLFFVNNKQFESKLTPYLNGLTATYVNTIMAKEDTKEHLILNVFDEFLTMKIDEATRKTLLTATRSKGFCNLLVAQYLINDEKLIQDLDSSRYALITFNINDDFTLQKVLKKISSAEALAASSSPAPITATQNKNLSEFNGTFGGGIINSLNSQEKGDGISYNISSTNVMIENQLQSMPKYHHLTFIPSEEVQVVNNTKYLFKLMLFEHNDIMQGAVGKNDFLSRENGILYLGYTPQAVLSYNNNSFEKWDMKDYYLSNKNKEKRFDNEEEEFIHYMNIKFSESVEKCQQYMNQHGLERYDIDTIFKNVEEDVDKVNALLLKYNEEKRFKMMNDFFELKDLKSQYNFAKENGLIGAILGIFTFSKDFEERKLQEIKNEL